MANYKVPVEETILNLLKTNLGQAGPIKDYYFGDPWQIPATSLPCIIVDVIRERVTQTTMIKDDVTTSVLIKLVMNKRDDFDKPGREARVKRKLREILSGRDPSTGEYNTASVMYILRKNYRLGIGGTGQEAVVEFNDTTKNPGVVYAEARIALEVTERVTVNGRT